jgi:carbon-monoxide dehydrogenase medium subunit
VVNVAVRVGVADDNICRDVRIALGAVAPTPLRAKKAEDILKGKKLQGELLRSVASQASEEIKPIDDVRSSAGYRVILSGVLVERALKEAIIRLSA